MVEREGEPSASPRGAPRLEPELGPGWTWAGILQSAMYRAALQGWKRGRRNQDPDADAITDRLLKTPEIQALNTLLAKMEARSAPEPKAKGPNPLPNLKSQPPEAP